jgi:acyl-CoA thioesterase YciA
MIDFLPLPSDADALALGRSEILKTVAEQLVRVPTKPRGQLASRTLAVPADTNPLGGWITSTMDAAAAITATTYAKGHVVTASVSYITFMQPIRGGDVVCCYVYVDCVGGRSVTLHLEVWVLRQNQGGRVKITDAKFAFVAVNDNGRPHPEVREPTTWVGADETCTESRSLDVGGSGGASGFPPYRVRQRLVCGPDNHRRGGPRWPSQGLLFCSEGVVDAE